MIFIAEFCQNHNGDFEILKEMVWAAKEAGADYAKIQTIFANMLSFRERFEEGILENGIVKVIKRPFQLEYDRLKKLELTLEQQAEFIDICHKAGIKPLTTTFNRTSIPILKDLGFTEIKIASYDCSSFPLLIDVKRYFSKIFVSTGATYDNEIIGASNILNGCDFSFFHCVTIYPTPLIEFHLSRMDFLRQFTKNIGWSDHSLVSMDGILGTIAAIYFGADLIERHFTILDVNQTKDGPVSVNPKHVEELKFVASLPRVDLKLYLEERYPNYKETLGNPRRIISDAELLNRDYYRGRFVNKREDGSFTYNWEE